jgi:hypothetical protein
MKRFFKLAMREETEVMGTKWYLLINNW